MANPWRLYDDLIDCLPSGIKVADFAVSTWCCIKASNGGAGAVFTEHTGPRPQLNPSQLLGADLKDVASWVKSWSFVKASIGQAALNSWFNSPDRFADFAKLPQLVSGSCFEAHLPKLAGKKVAMIGHFKDAARVSQVAELTILERVPQGDDLPDPACEYVLADQDWVYITGETLLNKTLPRLLQLCQSAHVVLVGPSVTFAPEVFGDSVCEFAGVQITDPDLAIAATKLGGAHQNLKPAFRPVTLDCGAEN